MLGRAQSYPSSDSRIFRCPLFPLLQDFCLWAPPNPNSEIGETEAEEVAWCTASGKRTPPLFRISQDTNLSFIRSRSSSHASRNHSLCSYACYTSLHVSLLSLDETFRRVFHSSDLISSFVREISYRSKLSSPQLKAKSPVLEILPSST